MGAAKALAQARRLLAEGSVVSAANVLVNDARGAAREALEPPENEPPAAAASRDALVHALGLAVARLQQHRDAMRDAPADPGDAPPVEERESAPKKGREKKGKE